MAPVFFSKTERRKRIFFFLSREKISKESDRDRWDDSGQHSPAVAAGNPQRVDWKKRAHSSSPRLITIASFL